MASTFGDKLKAARKRRGMVQTKLGEYTGVGQVTIANYEKGIRFPGEETLKSLAEVLNVSLDYLMSVSPSKITDGSLSGDNNSAIHTIDVLIGNLLNSSIEPAADYLHDWIGANNFPLQETFETIVIPTLVEVGKRWARGELSVAEEHLISAKIREFIISLGTTAAAELGHIPKNGKVWIGFSAPGEEHDMVLLMISRLMKLRGWDVAFLGTGVPLPDLLGAIDLYKPDIIASSITMEKNRNGLDAYLYSVLAQLKPDCRMIVGGQGLNESIYKDTHRNYGIADSIQDAIKMAEE